VAVDAVAGSLSVSDAIPTRYTPDPLWAREPDPGRWGEVAVRLVAVRPVVLAVDVRLLEAVCGRPPLLEPLP
jgi:hypothetical protein